MSIIIVSGPCDFQNGLCGLRNDVNSESQWTTGMTPTSSVNTGPFFDHTTLSNQGNGSVMVQSETQIKYLALRTTFPQLNTV